MVSTTTRVTRTTTNIKGGVNKVKVGMGKGRAKTQGLSANIVTILILLASIAKPKRYKSLI